MSARQTTRRRLRGLLFPPRARFFRGQRWASIALRTLHLIGVAGAGGGFLGSAPVEQWAPYLQLTLASGIGLSVLYVWSEGVWLLQLRGQAVLAKLLLLGAMPWFPGAEAVLFLTLLVISGVMSHAPARVRYYSLVHRRVIETGDHR